VPKININEADAIYSVSYRLNSKFDEIEEKLKADDKVFDKLISEVQELKEFVTTLNSEVENLNKNYHLFSILLAIVSGSLVVSVCVFAWLIVNLF